MNSLTWGAPSSQGAGLSFVLNNKYAVNMITAVWCPLNCSSRTKDGKFVAPFTALAWHRYNRVVKRALGNERAQKRLWQAMTCVNSGTRALTTGWEAPQQVKTLPAAAAAGGGGRRLSLGCIHVPFTCAWFSCLRLRVRNKEMKKRNLSDYGIVFDPQRTTGTL
jgi:hypothetical protein